MLSAFRCLQFAALIFVVCLATAAQSKERSQNEPYDYQKSKAYAELSDQQRKKLAEAERSLKIVEAALHKYADDHNNQAPSSLGDLVPKYLDKLPKDSFATKESAAEKIEYMKPSLKGYGFRYRCGSGRSWWLYSSGLKDFPYRYDSKNNRGVGLVDEHGNRALQGT